MNVFKEIFMSREEKSVRQKRKKVSNEENPPIATDVELIVDHSVWHKGKEMRTFGQGPLFLVIDGEPGPKPLPEPESLVKEPKKKKKDPNVKGNQEKKPKGSRKPIQKPEISQRQTRGQCPTE